jgi:hypothetical protein
MFSAPAPTCGTPPVVSMATAEPSVAKLAPIESGVVPALSVSNV